MWLFTKQGFFSVVQNKCDSSKLHVRSQFNGDLERLLCRYGIVANIDHTPSGDYQYRCDVDRDDFARIVSEEASAIDYEKFKPAVHDGTIRDTAYAEVFLAMMDAGRNAD